LLGSLAAGVLLFVYEWYSTRDQEEGSHHQGPGARNYSAEDLFDSEEITRPEEDTNARPPSHKLPSIDEKCSICLELLFKIGSRKYSVIPLPKCGHWFHHRCALRLLEYHPYCPVCREPVDSSMLRSTPVRFVDSRDGGSSTSGDQASLSCRNNRNHTSKDE